MRTPSSARRAAARTNWTRSTASSAGGPVFYLPQVPHAHHCRRGALAAGLLTYFWHTRQPWLYSYTVILVAAVLSIFFLSGGEI